MVPATFCLVSRGAWGDHTSLYFANISGFYYQEGYCYLCRRFFDSEDLRRFRDVGKVEVFFTNVTKCPFPVEEYKFVVEGIFLAIVVGFGVIGNLLSLIKFCKQRTQKLFHFLLVALAVFDTVPTNHKMN